MLIDHLWFLFSPTSPSRDLITKLNVYLSCFASCADTPSQSADDDKKYDGGSAADDGEDECENKIGLFYDRFGVIPVHCAS